MWNQSSIGFLPVKENPNVLKQLPAGKYLLKTVPMLGFVLEPINSEFTFPPKMYGKVEEKANLILNTFLNRTGKVTSAVLAGGKGLGKTNLSRYVCNLGITSNLPVIIINEAYCGDDFNSFIQSIDQPAIILMDEFEKVYREQEHLDKLLTLFDGSISSHKLFLLTMNRAFTDSNFPYFHNRPSRVYFAIEYNNLEEDVIKEYLEDHLVNKDKTDEIVLFCKSFHSFNLDLLTILVSEVNKNPDLSLNFLTSLLNMKPTITSNHKSFFKKLYDPQGKDISNQSGIHFNLGSYVGNSTYTSSSYIYLDDFDYDKDVEEQEGKYIEIAFNAATSILTPNESMSEFLVKNEEGYVLKLTEVSSAPSVATSWFNTVEKIKLR